MSILANPPSRSRLKKLVDHFSKGVEPVDGDWTRPDPEGTIFTIHRLLSEPRLWKLPRALVRDMLVIPAIENVHGTRIAATLREAPELLDEFTDLICEQAYRDAKDHDRRAPKHSNANLSRAIVFAELRRYSREAPETTWGNRCEAVSKRLGPGTDRHFVDRAGRKEIKILARLSGEALDLRLFALNAIAQEIAVFNGGPPPGVRNRPAQCA